MNKISAEEIEITLDLVEEQMLLTTSFDNYKPLTTQESDKIVRAARLAQSEVARQILYTILRSVGNVFSAIQDGGQMVGPLLVGVVADAFGLGTSSMFLGVLLLAGVGLIVMTVGETIGDQETAMLTV